MTPKMQEAFDKWLNEPCPGSEDSFLAAFEGGWDAAIAAAADVFMSDPHSIGYCSYENRVRIGYAILALKAQP